MTARDRDGVAYLTSDGAVFQISRSVGTAELKPRFKKASYSPETSGFESSFVRMKTVGANPNPRAVGIDRLPGVTNYFIGDDPAKWKTNVAGYAKVKYEGVYPGIDLVYYDNGEGSLEYDFIVAPGADPSRIALSIEDAQSVEVDLSGDLVISALTGTIRKPAPKVYQEIDGKQQEITASYRLLDTRHSSLDTRPSTVDTQTVAFALGAYDRKKPLVIDPQILYATYLGGSSTSTVANEGARGVAVDAQGSVYVVGTTVSTNFPTKNPAQNVLKGFTNAFITKLDANGQLVYSTYLGGSGFDEGTVIKVDDTGAAYVGGSTGSFDFPTVNSIQGTYGLRSDGFITKLSPTGSQIVYSTYLGGADSEGVADLALDAQKNVYVVGNIAPALGVPANDFPTVNPIQAIHGGGMRDGFLSVINSVGSSLLFSTYLGGNGDDFFQSIGPNPTNGNFFISFFTDSSNFPAGTSSDSMTPQADGTSRSVLGTARGSIDGNDRFIVVIEETGKITIVEPSVDKQVFGLDLASAFVLGTSVSSFGSPQDGMAQDLGGLNARLIVFDQNLNIAKTTFFGGSGEDTISGLASDAKGAAYVIGNTTSTDLPVVNPIQANRSGGNASFEGFLAVFHPKTLEPVFATYLGGTGMEFLNGVTVDPQGNIYVVGETFGNFPNSTAGAIQKQLSGRTDAFIIKISPVGIPLGNTPVDFDGDGKSDIGVYRDGNWFIQRSSDGGVTGVGWGGLAQDTPVPADYDGDGKADIAVYRSSDGGWYIVRSSDGGVTGTGWGGLAQDIAVPGDYDGDGKSDIAIYRSGGWYILRSSDGGVSGIGWGGLPQDIPVPGDYDGDGKADIAIYRKSDGGWYILRSSDGGVTLTGWGGLAQDIPVPGDYDGDGKTDVAVYRNGGWYILRSSDGGVTGIGWGGLPQDKTVPADYDGDGKTDVAVYRDGGWLIIRSSDGGVTAIGWGGLAQDVPLN